jgi:hypothetical protein
MHYIILPFNERKSLLLCCILALVFLVFLLANGLVATFATTTAITEPMQSPETMNQTQTTPTQEESVRVAVG